MRCEVGACKQARLTTQLTLKQQLDRDISCAKAQWCHNEPREEKSRLAQSQRVLGQAKYAYFFKIFFSLRLGNFSDYPLKIPNSSQLEPMYFQLQGPLPPHTREGRVQYPEHNEARCKPPSPGTLNAPFRRRECCLQLHSSLIAHTPPGGHGFRRRATARAC